MTAVLGQLIDQLRGVYGARRWIIAVDVVQAATPILAGLRQLGAGEVLIAAASDGVGPRPDAPAIVLGLHTTDMMRGIHESEALLSALPPEAVAEVDRFDPDGSARVIRSLFSTDAPVAGRRCFGGRPAAWRAYEDKLLIDAFWDRAGVARAPSEVVPADPAALAAAHARLDRGRGTVWAADNREGWHGGAHGLRWVRRPAELAEAAAWLQGRADAARVMPWLDGVPCSIHGIQGAGPTLVLRPCEMLVFPDRESCRLKYGQASTYWDPPPPQREQLRAVARAAGQRLRAEVGFRGTFTVDGVMTDAGFFPTELNPRFGAAIGLLARSLPELPLYLLHLAVIEGLELDVPALEPLLLAQADAHRAAGSMQVVPGPRRAPASAGLHREGEGYVVRDTTDGAAFEASLGPSPSGSFVLLRPMPGALDVGPPSAPRVAAAWRALDRAWGLGLGDLVAATELGGP